MVTDHALSSLGTRPPHQPRLKIDPFPMSHSLPHLLPEDHFPQSMSPSNYSLPSANTSAMSPYSSSHSAQASPTTTPKEDGTLWNLVPYDIPWGQDYFAYKAGRLPGPDGDCLFLRSPTPVEKKRTVRACEKCRERKAKCSGDRPTCMRCFEKGRTCVYTSDSRRTRVSGPDRAHGLQDRLISSFSQRRRDGPNGGTPSSSSSSFDFSDAHAYEVFTPKQEEDDESYSLFTSPPSSRKSSYGGHPVAQEPSLDGHSNYQSVAHAQGQGFDFYGSPELPTDLQHVTGHGEFVSLLPNLTSSLAPPIYAPKPLRYGQALFPSLNAVDTEFCVTDEIAPPPSAVYEPHACVDPNVLMRGHLAAAIPAPQATGSSPYPAEQPVHLCAGMSDTAPVGPPMPITSGHFFQPVHDVPIYPAGEVHGNPAASQHGPSPFVSYTLHYRFALDPLERSGSSLLSF